MAIVANAEQTLLYWRLDDRIRRDILNEKRASYSEEIVSAQEAGIDRLVCQLYGLSAEDIPVMDGARRR